jgi:serine/threonine protein kinase
MGDLSAFPPALARRYRPLAFLGAGGVGMVLEVLDLQVGRKVALKLLLHGDDPVHRRRFKREAAILARLEHPGVLRVYDFGEADGTLFMVTELLEGQSLDELAGRLEDPDETMLQAADALDAVHAQGLVHRDLKPANLIRTRVGRVVLLDFGLALPPRVTRLTREDVVVGTLACMAPEVLQLQDAGPAADWYGWGATFFWLYESRPPYTPSQILAFVDGGDFPPLRFRRLAEDARAATVIRAALEVDPVRRLAGRRAIERLLRGTVTRGPLVGRRQPAQSRPRAALDPRGPITVATLALGTLLALRAPRPLAAPEPTPTRATTSDLGRSLQALEDELTEAGDLFLSPTGERRAFPSRNAPEGWSPLLSRAPRRWVNLLPHLPVLSDTLQGALRDGPMGDFDPQEAAALRAYDTRLNKLGLPRFFAPILDGGPGPRLRTTPELVEEIAEREELVPVRGHLAVAVEASRSLEAWCDAVNRAHDRFQETGEDAPLLSEAVFPRGTVLSTRNVQECIKWAMLVPERRVQAMAWLREPAELLRRALARAFRAPVEGTDPDAVAEFVAQVMNQRDEIFFSEVGLLPPEALVRQPARDELAMGVASAALLRQLCRVRRHLDLPWRPLAARREAPLRRVLAGPAEVTEALRWALPRSVFELCSLQLELGHTTEALDTARSHLPMLEGARDPEHLRDLVRLLLATWLARPEHPATRAAVPRVLRWGTTRLREGVEDDSGFLRDVETLRKAWRPR